MLKDTGEVNTYRPRRRRNAKADWTEYEREKRKLYALNMMPDEYERRIKEITKRLGV